MNVEFLGDLLDGFDALERLKRYAGFEFGVVSSSFAFHFLCVRFGLNAAPTHHNHSLTAGLIFWVRLREHEKEREGRCVVFIQRDRPKGCQIVYVAILRPKNHHRKTTHSGAYLRRGGIVGEDLFGDGLDLICGDVEEVFAGLLGGAIITESVFSVPGMGTRSIRAVVESDLPVLVGTTMVAAVFIVLANVLVDIAYGYLDPRVRVK